MDMSQVNATSSQSQAASAACSMLHRAYRDRRLYPPGHPTSRESTDAFAGALAEYMDQWGALVLEVREDVLTLEGEPVYSREASRDNLAFLMFHDGLRTLSLHPGCDTGELEALVDALASAEDLANMEHDLATALWERDLTHIDYQVVDPLMGGSSLRGGLVDALRETVTRRLESVYAQAVSAAEAPEGRMRRIKVRSYEEDAFQLTPEEMDRGERAVQSLSSVNQDYAEVLLEVAGKIPIESSGDVVVLSLAAVVGAYLDDDDLDGAMFVLDHLGRLEAERWCPGGTVGFVAGDAVTADRLRELLQKARQASPERYARMEQFLLRVRRWITPSLLEILTEAGDRSVRKTVLEILGEQNAVPWPDLEPLLRDARWYVVRNAVQLAAQMGHEEVADHSGRLLAHADVRVRRETVRALGRLNSQGALRGLTQALSDRDPAVRVLAANAVGRKGRSEQVALLLDRIEDRTFASLSPEEMEAFLGAYAALVQDAAVPMLGRFWKKSILSAKPLPLRVAAVLALGYVRGPAGVVALQAAAKSDEQQIRRAAADAVQRAKARWAGDQR
jgi:hypothetical protein